MSTDKTGGAVTQWFRRDCKPIHIGPYQRNYGMFNPENPTYSYWNGSYWAWVATSPFAAAMEPMKSDHQNLPWRGLADKP